MKLLTKKILPLMMVLAVTFSFFPWMNSDKVYAEENTNVKYHLDMGVWSIPQGNIAQKDTIRPVTVNLAFPTEIKVKNIYWFDGDRKFLNDMNFWNITTLNCVKGNNGTDKRNNYRQIYDRYTTSSLTNISAPTVNGNKISYSYTVKLTGKELTYDIGEIFKKQYVDKTKYTAEAEELSKPVLPKETIKKYENLLDLVVGIINLFVKNAEDQLTNEQIEELETSQENEKKYEDILAGNHEVYGQKAQQEANKVDQKVLDYKNHIYRFWVGMDAADPTAAMAEYAKTNPDIMGIYNSIEETVRRNMAGQSTSHWLVFFPTVIEYTVSDKCTVCQKDELESSDPGYCTSSSCKYFGTPECGCYNICDKCQICHIDRAGTGESVCSARSCSSWNTTKCGCYNPPVVTGNCKSYVKWTERKSHKYKHSPGCKKRSDGTRYCPGHNCVHIDTYELKMKVSGTIKADKPNGKQTSTSTTFKSGYGFAVTGKDSTSTGSIKKVSGSKTYSGCNYNPGSDAKVTPCNKAQVKFPSGWQSPKNNTKKVTQANPFSLTGSGGNFSTPVNPLSNKNNKLIYTHVSLAGTRKAPKTHNIDIYFSGGLVKGSYVNVPLCAYLSKEVAPLKITINGNMYEDDSTSDRK